MTPTTSVVVITHNRRGEVLRTVRTLLRVPEQLSIIVVDNGSTDGTSTAIAHAHPELTLLALSRNLGAVARNLAVACVDTPYVAFCDDDTWWDPGALEHAATLLGQHPDLAAVMAHCLVEPGGSDDPLTEEVRDSPVPAPDWLPGPALLSVLAGVTVFRTAAFRRAGGFSPKLWLGGEEELLSIDLVTDGWWLCWVEDMIARHYPSTARDPRGRRQLGIRNALWTSWTRRPFSSAVRRSRDILASAPKDRYTLTAILKALGGVFWVVQQRKVVPPHIEAALRMLESSQRNSRARRYVG